LLHFCLTLKNIHDDPNYKVKLPVFLDATCSGIQQLATLLLDKELAKKKLNWHHKLIQMMCKIFIKKLRLILIKL